MRHSSPWSGDLTADSPELDAGRFTQTKLSVWFGNETEGISEPAIKASALCVSIPMFGVVESLNLGTCTGIVLYEITKKRGAYIQKKLVKKAAA